MFPEVIASLISAVVGGFLVAVVNHLFTMKKTDKEAKKFEAEAKKLEAEAEKIRVETAKILAEFGKLNATIKDANYRIIYDGRQNADIGDFEPKPNKMPDGEDKEIAQGLFSVKEGILIVERKNIGGRFHVFLRKYVNDGKERDDYLPKNELLEGKRRLRVSFDAKVTKGSHTLLVILKNPETERWLAHQKVVIDYYEWKPIELIFRVPPSENCYLRFDDQAITILGSLHLRNLTFAEYIN